VRDATVSRFNPPAEPARTVGFGKRATSARERDLTVRERDCVRLSDVTVSHFNCPGPALIGGRNFPVPSLWAKLRLGHSSAERRPGIADVKNGVTGRVRSALSVAELQRTPIEGSYQQSLFGEFSGHGFQDLGSQLWSLDFHTRGFQDRNLKTFRT
jgi:hypothetical protein